ncbi:hypothetical protein BKA66DRAFT_573014 [Pyrenochaeta sp. MPI-SDFR-AT-0127]|nr:hypothetical protein BKA66DRAFT_573014 [Pyrenochaeta sp. MPI-SDFR-AT-0127]
MTRPQIIRADTLDLQDKSSPTAQDHSLQPQHPAPLGIGPAAPHQQAAIRHVEEERSSEEARLQNAWGNAGAALREDPGSDDERTVVNHAHVQNGLQQDEQAIRLNGGISGDADDSDMHDADADDDLDDDMMDKISSSPSIDDGGYSSASYPAAWPARRDSLTPQSSPMLSTVASSSPFTNTPIHFPISFPLLQQISQSTKHHSGEYPWTNRADIDTEAELEVRLSPRSKALKEFERRLQMIREDSVASLLSEYDGQGRVLDSPAQNDSTANGTPESTYTVRHDEDEDDSWTTDSDADSWDQHQDDDACNDVSFSDDPRFIDSGWGGECLQDTEDIDFEFVYALHTFVATVEGQANATKGDTMVLLDDSNSYWWLVRVVKDSSIGYLPAEHIETPTERLARLNKHRNIDLSATMLGDTAEKSKNPLKKAMRRRNAKTVQFAPPTYVEASDYDYSSDEGDGELFGGPEPKQAQQQQVQQQQTTQNAEPEQDDGLKVQPLKTNGAKKDANGQVESDARSSSDSTAKREDDKQRASDDSVDRPLDPKITRNGTLRNTDSFFKDENTETRKITLTPNLLRDDSTNSTAASRERGPSLESLEKNGFADKVKDKKEKKEKKSGMLSGLFKRKDKKAKGMHDSQDSDVERTEDVDRASPQSKPSDELEQRPSGEQTVATAPQRNPSKGKLQKSQRSRDDSPQKTKGILKMDSPTEPVHVDGTSDKPTAQQATSTMRLVSPEQENSSRPSTEERTLSPDNRPAQTSMGSNNPFSKMMKPQQTSEPKPEKVKQSKQRVQLDDFDSDESSDPFADPDAQTRSTQPDPAEATGRLSESPVHVSVADGQPSVKTNLQDRDKESDSQQLPGLTTDNSSQETTSPVSTPSPDDSPMKTIPENSTLSISRTGKTPSPTSLAPNGIVIPPPSRPAPVPGKTDAERGISPPNSSDSTILPAWSDASLRAYLDDGSDVRDMLLMINDVTGVVPVSRDHPFMKNLFVEETKTVQGLSGELDRLLNGLMEKRMKRAGSGASKVSTASGRSMNGNLSVNGGR